MSAPVEDPRGSEEEAPPPPISFWLMIGLAVLYLGWRFVQGLMWLVDWIF